MSLRQDQRVKKMAELKAYDTVLDLSTYTIQVCKPKDKKPNGHHIVKRYIHLGKEIETAVIEIGANVLEANQIYVGANLNTDGRIQNYIRRIALEEKAKSLTFRVEHIIRILHSEQPFSENTLVYWIALLCEAREALSEWIESERKRLSALKKGDC